MGVQVELFVYCRCNLGGSEFFGGGVVFGGVRKDGIAGC